MSRANQPRRKPTADPRYDVNRTLTTYQPVTPEGVVQSVPEQTDNTPKVASKKRSIWKRSLLVIFLILALPVGIIGFIDYQHASSASQKLFGTGNVLSALFPTGLEKTNGRTNIILIGYSADDPGHGGADLTDSILVVSLDKDKKTGYQLSVPRDLYVDIPDYGSAKINEAYQAGERQGFTDEAYPAGGVGLLEKVVSDTFGIPIHYSVIINYGAVRGITDALDGITVVIDSPDERGIYDPNFKPEEGGPLQLANGPQEIDGQTALRLTRARGSTAGSYGLPQSDFNRTQNQQKVFAAIKSEINLKLLLDPRSNEAFFDAIGDNVETDIGLREVIPLFRLFQSVPETNLQQINLTKANGINLLGSYRTPSGQSALVPAAGISDYSAIQEYLSSL